MILSRRASLGGVQLDEIHPAIVIKSTDPGVPNETVTTTERMGGFGQRQTGQHWNTLEARVVFGIDLYKRDLAARDEVFDLVMAWAKAKRWLEFTHMPGKRLYVDKIVYPGRGDLWNWTAEYPIIFRANNVPFWQQKEPNKVVKNISTGSVNIEVGGTAPSVLDITFRNISGKTIPNFSVKAGKNRIDLKGVNLGGTETLKISHGTDGILRIKAGSRDVYGLYTGADDLFVEPGNVTVNVEAVRAGELTVTSYGRYV